MENIQQVTKDNLSELNLNDVTRCPNCNLICLLKLYYKEGQPIIIYSCENNHKGRILLKDYLNIYNKYSLLKEKCKECGKTQNEIKGNFFYCLEYNMFLCYLCGIKNSNKEHNLINIKKYDSFCKIHSNSYYYYCKNCNKNLCGCCKKEHFCNNIIDILNNDYSKESLKKLEIQMENLEIIINNLNIIKEKINFQLNELKEKSKTEIEFIKLLLKTYKYEEKVDNLNYNVIQNLNNFKNKIEKYEKIYEESIKYFSLIYSVTQSNPFQNNFKTLYYHHDSINYLTQLQDGRLASCGNDKRLNIYSLDKFDLDLSIQPLDYCYSFTQLNDGRIITCSNPMKIIQLIGYNNYHIEQRLNEHDNEVIKVIEIRKNELISISKDCKMKIWRLNSHDLFECNLNIDIQNSYSFYNILKLNEKEFATLSSDNDFIKFWNSINYLNIATINNIQSNYTLQNMCLIEDDLLCIGGSKTNGFYIIKISNHQLIKKIIGPKNIYSIFKCLDNLILCSMRDEDDNEYLVKYKYDNQELIKIIEKKKAHNKCIIICIELNNEIIVSGGKDEIIKLWKDENL